jgi:hypothetical protein
MSEVYVIGTVNQRDKRLVCQIVCCGSQQECCFLLSLIGKVNEANYFMLPESIYQKLPLDI